MPGPGFRCRACHAPFRRSDERLRQQAQASPLLQGGMAAANGVLTALQLGDTLKGYFRKPVLA
ncbi:hypothetical protein GCM10023185_42660 [Hymenobacter saemangeumensis]|uniref:Uncharacterized protein n=1 Tax=Hymenobacter saemangeumensis TaxID=1084522 RepID=A0ABP8ISJ8_9BACT